MAVTDNDGAVPVSAGNPGSASSRDPLPPDGWPGAGGRRSVAPEVPQWPGRPVSRPADPGTSWPGAAPSGGREGACSPEAGRGLAGAGSASVGDGDRALRLREPTHLVSPKAKRLWLVSAMIGWLFPVAALILWSAIDSGHRTWQLVSALVVLLLAVPHLLIMPVWRYRVHRWEVTDLAVYTQTGWFNQERHLAPISRIQTVDSEFGPLERMFGLGTVRVTTASAAGPQKVSGLERQTVEHLVTELTEIAARSRSDAT